MRIAYPVFDYSKSGGVERVVKNMARICGEKGHEIHIFSSSIPGNGDHHAMTTFHNVAIPPAPFFMRFYLFSRLASRQLKKHKFDIIHNQGADSRVQDVITAHSCHRAWLEYVRRTSTAGYIKRRLNPAHSVIIANEKLNYSPGNYKKIIAVSGNVKQDLMTFYGVPEKDISVIPLGVDTTEFTPENKLLYRNNVRQSYNISDDEFLILLVANELRRKGLSVLLKALANMRDIPFRLMVVGCASTLAYAAQAQRLGIKDRVLFIRATADIKRYYACADAFVMPTQYEPFGLVIIEAMASGLPVIVSKCAGASSLLDEKQLIQNPLDVNEVAGKIRCLAEDSGFRTAAAKNALSMVQKLSWENTTEQVISVYKSIER